MSPRTARPDRHSPARGFLQRSLAAAGAGTLIAGIAGCATNAPLPESAGYGPTPALPEPREEWIPTIDLPRARGWSDGATPTPAAGLAVARFAGGLDHPRWLHVLPNGDVLVAETNAPPPKTWGGVRGLVMKRVKGRAGSGGPSADRITLLRDADRDGVADLRTPFLEGLRSPFGMELVGGDLYVASTDALWRFPYREGETRISAPGTRVAELPAGPRNRHWTRNVIASPEGARLFVAVGSDSNAAENGLATEERRAAILEVEARSGRSRVFASGLRNPVGMGWEPRTGALWTTVNERDEIGGDLVPDYMTAVQDGGFYGWPFSYFGPHVDDRVQPQRPDLVARAIVPDYALGAHTASLGFAFAEGDLLPPPFAEGAFIGQHGSWNRTPRSGYKVIFVPFRDGRPAGEPLDVLTGFLDESGDARGRPVGVAMDRDGALLVADDAGDTVWRVTPDATHAEGSNGRR